MSTKISGQVPRNALVLIDSFSRRHCAQRVASWSQGWISSSSKPWISLRDGNEVVTKRYARIQLIVGATSDLPTTREFCDESRMVDCPWETSFAIQRAQYLSTLSGRLLPSPRSDSDGPWATRVVVW